MDSSITGNTRVDFVCVPQFPQATTSSAKPVENLVRATTMVVSRWLVLNPQPLQRWNAENQASWLNTRTA